MEPGKFITRQQLGKHVPAATNTQAKIEELLESGVFCWVRSEAK
jgi:hypothetical protein